MKKLLAILMVMTLVISLASCKGDDKTSDEPTKVEDKNDATSGGEAEVEKEEPAEDVDMSKTGAKLDSITMIGVDDAAAVTQLEAGAIDIFAGSLPGEYLEEIEAAGLNYAVSTGLSYEIMLNNADTVDTAGTFNPFAIREVREAMNWLLDRDYICKEIFGGAAIPRQFAISSASPDYARYIDYARIAEAEYPFDQNRAVEQIEAAMADAGIEKNADGKYVFNGEPIVLKFYIRTEDGLRQPTGDYVSNQLEDIGFTVDRIYRVSAECSPVVFGSEPLNGEWHLYTGAWGASGLARDTGIYFHDYVSPDSRYGYNPWTAFKISDEYNEILTKLANNVFTSMDERAELFEAAFAEHNYWATRIWIADGLAYTPWNTNVSTSYNLSAGVDGDNMTAYTMEFNDMDGGDLVWGNSAPPFVNPVNPIAGTNWTYDSQYLNMTRDYPVIADPYTGLRYPKRITSGEVVVQTGLPVGKTYDWVDLSFEDEIKVPADAMIDWDVASSTWINADADYFAMKVAKAEEAVAAAETALADAADDDAKALAEAGVASAKQDLEAAQAAADMGYLTAKRKSVVTFEEGLSGLTWHDGTPVTLADIMMSNIMVFETAYEESPYYDPYVAPAFLSSQPYFKGWRIVSEDPITIEVYSESFMLDAENNITELGSPSFNWTYDSTGAQSSWHGIAIGNRVMEGGKAVYAEGTADADDTVEWMNYLDGPSLEFLATATDELIAESYVPFEATMGKYITAEDAKAAYEATKAFYETNNHFVVGNGPYYISNVLSTEGSITLSRYEDYIEASNRWAFLSEPKIAAVELDGPSSVTVGSEATFEVYVSDPADAAYPIADITFVKYLLFNSKGEIIAVEEVTSDTDGLYEIVLSESVTKELGEGSCKIEVVVAPKAVAAPTILQTEFLAE